MSAKCAQVPTVSGVVPLVQTVPLAMLAPPDGRNAPESLLPFKKYASVSRWMIVRQPLCAAVGCTHASNVMADPRFKLVALLTNTRAFTPLNESALPNLPVVQVAPLIDPVLPLPDRSSTVAPVFSSNE